MIPYQYFNRSQWAMFLRDYIYLDLTEDEIKGLKKIDADLSIGEITEIYLPLSRLLNFYYNSNLQKQLILKRFLNIKEQRTPYIISITGSVSVGKSTTARILQTLLNRWPKRRNVELVNTDGFLHPNQILKEQGIMKKKGFPLSYDMHRLAKFVADVKSGMKNVTAPVYSHLIYDVIPNSNNIIVQPDIMILEGLNLLQKEINYLHNSNYDFFVSDFVDFSIYIDAPEKLLKDWYVNRFLKFRKKAFTNPKSYFYNYLKISKNEAIIIATSLWNEINDINLKENILPTKKHANLILIKSKNHVVNKIKLRK